MHPTSSGSPNSLRERSARISGVCSLQRLCRVSCAGAVRWEIRLQRGQPVSSALSNRSAPLLESLSCSDMVLSKVGGTAVQLAVTGYRPLPK